MVLPETILTGLIHNVTLIVTLVVILNLGDRMDMNKRTSGIIIGFGTGALGIGLWLTSWELTTGLTLNTLSILMSVSGVFLGKVQATVLILLLLSHWSSVSWKVLFLLLFFHLILFASGMVLWLVLMAAQQNQENHHQRKERYLAMENKILKGTTMVTVALLFLALGHSAWAGGSFIRDDLLHILEQQPAIAAWVVNGLDLDESGYAMRIGLNVNPNLGGLRVGPYTILAKPKGVRGPFTLEVTVETECNGLDDAGKTR